MLQTSSAKFICMRLRLGELKQRRVTGHGSDTEAVDGKAVRWEGNLEGGGVLKAANHMRRII